MYPPLHRCRVCAEPENVQSRNESLDLPKCGACERWPRHRGVYGGCTSRSTAMGHGVQLMCTFLGHHTPAAGRAPACCASAWSHGVAGHVPALPTAARRRRLPRQQAAPRRTRRRSSYIYDDDADVGLRLPKVRDLRIPYRMAKMVRQRRCSCAAGWHTRLGSIPRSCIGGGIRASTARYGRIWARRLPW